MSALKDRSDPNALNGDEEDVESDELADSSNDDQEDEEEADEEDEDVDDDYANFLRSVFNTEDGERSEFSIDDDDDEYQPVKGSDDEDDDCDDDDLVQVAPKELVDLVDGCWQTLAGEQLPYPEDLAPLPPNSDSRSTGGTALTHDEGSEVNGDGYTGGVGPHDGFDGSGSSSYPQSIAGASIISTQTADNIMRKAKLQRTGLRGSVKKSAPSLISSLVRQIFSGEKPSSICVDGMPVDAIRKIVARQMSMASQLLIQMLLLSEDRSNCFNSSYTRMMELSNQREASLKKAALVQMNFRNLSAAQQRSRGQTSSSGGAGSGGENLGQFGSPEQQQADMRLTRAVASRRANSARSTSVFDIPMLADVTALFDAIDICRREVKEAATSDLTDCEHGIIAVTPSVQARARMLTASTPLMERLSSGPGSGTGHTRMRLWNCLLPTPQFPLSQDLFMRTDPSSLTGRSLFTPAEDDLLLRGILDRGEGDSSWTQIKNCYLPSKEEQLLQFRFRQMTAASAGPSNFKRYLQLEKHIDTREKWSNEEDLDLLRGYHIYGDKWPLISIFFLPHRTRKDIKLRWQALQMIWQRDFSGTLERISFQTELPAASKLFLHFVKNRGDPSKNRSNPSSSSSSGAGGGAAHNQGGGAGSNGFAGGSLNGDFLGDDDGIDFDAISGMDEYWMSDNDNDNDNNPAGVNGGGVNGGVDAGVDDPDSDEMPDSDDEQEEEQEETTTAGGIGGGGGGNRDTMYASYPYGHTNNIPTAAAAFPPVNPYALAAGGYGFSGGPTPTPAYGAQPLSSQASQAYSHPPSSSSSSSSSSYLPGGGRTQVSTYPGYPTYGSTSIPLPPVPPPGAALAYVNNSNINNSINNMNPPQFPYGQRGGGGGSRIAAAAAGTQPATTTSASVTEVGKKRTRNLINSTATAAGNLSRGLPQQQTASNNTNNNNNNNSIRGGAATKRYRTHEVPHSVDVTDNTSNSTHNKRGKPNPNPSSLNPNDSLKSPSRRTRAPTEPATTAIAPANQSTSALSSSPPTQSKDVILQEDSMGSVGGLDLEGLSRLGYDDLTNLSNFNADIEKAIALARAEGEGLGQGLAGQGHQGLGTGSSMSSFLAASNCNDDAGDDAHLFAGDDHSMMPSSSSSYNIPLSLISSASVLSSPVTRSRGGGGRGRLQGQSSNQRGELSFDMSIAGGLGPATATATATAGGGASTTGGSSRSSSRLGKTATKQQQQQQQPLNDKEKEKEKEHSRNKKSSNQGSSNGNNSYGNRNSSSNNSNGAGGGGLFASVMSGSKPR